jgi:hypothetical protein
MIEDTYAARIRQYWRERGYDVKVETVDSPGYGKAVRSNIVGGLPRDFKPTSAVIVDGKLIG